MRRRWLCAAVFLFAVAPAAAQQQTACLQLESQLAAIERQGAQSQQYQALQAQYLRDRAAYDVAYQQAAQMRCIVLFRRLAPATCGTMLAGLDRMRGNLTQLEQSLRTVDPAQAAATRTNILRALAAYNCGPQYAPYAQRQPAGLLDRLFGPQIGNPLGPGPLVATYRTLCVRACDGYYFPISFSTTPAQFGADEATCRAQCPGGDVALYVHLNPGAEVETAVNLAGDPYVALTNAFAFRTAFNPTCGCQPVTATAAAGGFTPITLPPTTQIVMFALSIPVPMRRPVPSEDPETLANRAGGLTPREVGVGDPQLVGVTGEGGMRLIGPAYYYGQ